MNEKLKRVFYTDFSNGLNNLDSAHFTDNSSLLSALNVDLVRGGIITRNGTELFNYDSTKTGGIKTMLPCYFADGTKYMVFANQDKWYQIQANIGLSDAWTSIGDYGTEVDNPRGYVYNDLAILGGGVGNTTKKWDGSNITDIGNPPTSGGLNLFVKMQAGDVASLFAAREGDSTLNWSVTENPNDWTSATSGSVIIGKNDGEQIRGLFMQGTVLWVFKDTKKYPVTVQYNETLDTWLPVVKPFVDNSGGTVSHDSIQVVTSNAGDDLHILSKKGDGVQSFGRYANFGDSPLGFSVSKLINPIIDKINWDKAHLSRAVVWKRKYMLACPYLSSTYNNIVFVRHLDTGGWTLYNNWNVGAWCIFKDSNGIDQLYFGDATAPKIYKVTEGTYSDNNGEYSREILTKKYSPADFTFNNELKYIDIFGYMSEATQLRVSLYIDDRISGSFLIDKTFIAGDLLSSYIGDNYIGDEYIGGGGVGEDEKLFFARIPIGDDMRYGRFIQLGLQNSGNGQNWQFNGFGITFLLCPNEYIDDKFIVKTKIS